MKRRTVLSAAAFGSVALAGCLEGSFGDGGLGGSNTTYEECTHSIIRVENLPKPARSEAQSALEDGVYETTDQVVLETVMDFGESYLRQNGEYYTVEIDEEGADERRVRFVETVPETGNPRVLSGFEDETAVELAIEYDGETLFEETLELDEGESVSAEGEFGYGGYRADVNSDAVIDEAAWSVDEYYSQGEIVVSEDGIDVQQAVVDPAYCEWDDDGALLMQ